MSTIVQRKSKSGEVSFQVRIRRKFAPALSGTFRSRADAKAWAIERERETLASRHSQGGERAAFHTFEELVGRWQAEHLPTLGDQQNPARIAEYWRKRIGALPLSQITPQLLADFRSELERRKGRVGKLKPATVRHYLMYLGGILEFARKRLAWVSTNPVGQVEKPKVRNHIVRFLTDAERKRLLAEAKLSQNPLLYPYVVLSLATGARRGELLWLTWGMVNMQAGTARIVRSKNGEPKTLHFVGAAHEALQQLEKMRKPNVPWLFPNTRGDGVAALRTSWQHALKRAGIVQFRVHDMRHDAASRLAMAGVSLPKIAALLGHKTLQMTARYSHLSPETVRDVAAQAAASL